MSNWIYFNSWKIKVNINQLRYNIAKSLNKILLFGTGIGFSYFNSKRIFKNSFCKVCGRLSWLPFLLKDDIWKSLGFTYKDLVCLTCVIEKLNRPIMKEDLKDVPINKDLLAILK